MDLSDRKLKILKAIIDDYIETGIPVGSRTLSKMPGFEYSSATIRNEMADLEDMGYLEQPHTSAGRTPSDKAYRLYVDRMMKIGELSTDETTFIRAYFNKRMGEISDLLDITAKVLSDTTNHIAVVAGPQLDNTKLKRIQIVKITDNKALLICVTDSGIVQDTMITVPSMMDSSQIERMSNMLTELTENKTLEQGVKIIQDVADGAWDEHKAVMNEVFEAINVGRAKHEMILEGAQNILRHPEYKDVEKAQHFLELLDTKDRIYPLLERSSDFEFSIRIGSENDNKDFNDMSVVTATYKLGGESVGSFGVIGPTRMDYSRVISVLNYVSMSLNEILSCFLEKDTKK